MLFTDCLLSTSHICGQQARVEGSPKGVISALLSGNPSPPATVSGLFCVVKGSRETGVPERRGAPTLGSWIPWQLRITSSQLHSQRQNGIFLPTPG